MSGISKFLEGLSELVSGKRDDELDVLIDKAGHDVTSKEGKIEFDHVVPILKIDLERRLVASVVYEPDIPDAHGDAMSRDEIEKSCHGFGIRYAQGHGELGTNHRDDASRAAIVPVETFLAPADFYLGKQLVTEGSWVMWSKVLDEELWKEVKAGTYTGYSFQGWGTRVAAA